MLKIYLTSVFVTDQSRALEFYTRVLGFEKKNDSPVGQFRWLTVISPAGAADVELLLEPNENPTARTYQQALFEQGIPAASFAVDNLPAEFERLKALRVEFPMEPSEIGTVKVAVLDDTCGNLIQLVQLD